MIGFVINTKIDENGKIVVTYKDDSNTPKSNREQKGTSLIDVVKDYCVIDIETTGLDSRFDEIIEISALKVRNNIVVDKYSALIKPRAAFYSPDAEEDFCIDEDGNKIRYIDEFISELTGITNQMLHEAGDMCDVLPVFDEFINDDILVGHNVNFDINFLYDNFGGYLKKPLSNNFIDTLRIARKILPELSHHRLDDLTKYFNMEMRSKHRALNDCVLTNEIYNELTKKIIEKYETIDTFKSLFKRKNHGGAVRAKDIIAKTDDFDEQHPLYGKVCVFTGTLEKMQRKDAMQVVANLGGICGDGVTAKTNYLILGNNDYCKNIKGGKSNKQKKAEKLKLEGQDIEIVSENVFYDMIEDYLIENSNSEK